MEPNFLLSSTLSPFERLPCDILNHILSFLNEKEIYPLLTTCSTIFPLVASKLWQKQALFYKFVNSKSDFRKVLFFQPPLPIENPKTWFPLPYLDYITELNIYAVNSEHQVLIVQKTPNCKYLTVEWTQEMALILLDALSVVPLLTSLTLSHFVKSTMSQHEFVLFETILLNRVDYLSILKLKHVPFCFYKTLATVLSKTKLVLFESEAHSISNQDKRACEVYSKQPLSGSSYLKYCSISFEQLDVKPPPYFLDWVHTSFYLTTLKIHLDLYLRQPVYNETTSALIYFLQTFPSFSPLKRLVLYNWHFHTSLNVSLSSLVSTDHVNRSLETLEIHFLVDANRFSYQSFIKLLHFFPKLKTLIAYSDKNPSYVPESNAPKTTPPDLSSFLSAFTSLNLVKLSMDLPNKIQRYLLPMLKTMSSLKYVDLCLDVGLLYQFLPQLTQVKQFIFRPLRSMKLEVMINNQLLELITEEEDHYYYTFNQKHLDLIRSTPLSHVRFIEKNHT